jgi:DNA-binding Lrp family transcriptional regulator
MSAGTYLLVKFDDREKLLPAVEKINQSETVLGWDAIDGHYNLLLKLKKHDNALIDSIKEYDGFSDFNCVDILGDTLPSVELDPEFTYSYLFIETDKNTTDAIKELLNSIESIVACIATTGSFDLLALVKGDTFDKIDRVIENEIKELDGLLRLKQDRIILLDTM